MPDDAGRSPSAGRAGARARFASTSAWNQWILHLANTVQPAFRTWFYPHEVDASEAIQAIAKNVARQRIEAAWSRIDTHLAAAGPYLLGAGRTAADLMLLMLMRWSRNMPKAATDWPALAAFASRMKAAPSWKRLCEVEGLTEWA